MRWIAWLLAGLAVVAAAWGLYVRFLRFEPGPVYGDELEHFKYGSIGAEVDGYPYLVWKVLPELFPDRIPEGWSDFGFVREEGRALPVGISVVKYGIERVGFNCAACHSTVVGLPDGSESFVPGAPAVALDLQAYLDFLAEAAADPRFTADEIFAALEASGDQPGWLDRLVYRTLIIPATKHRLARRAERNAWMDALPAHGPGRTDAGNPWKMKFGLKPETDPLTGAVDMPSLWNQRIRQGMWLHWDANNDSLKERNLSAALAGGASEASLDHRSIERVAAWALDLAPPLYPAAVEDDRLARGRTLYAQLCAECHDPSGARVGDATPIEEVGTDPDRWRLFDDELLAAFSTVGDGYDWQFTHYRRSEGYANQPLDGIWARGPYLHNGSVPTLADLLEAPAERPQSFFRGCVRLDPVRVGFRCEGGFLFDTRLQGNGNGGHEYGTELGASAKRDLLEYLKTL